MPVGEDVRPASSGRDGAVPGGPAALRRVSGADRGRRSRGCRPAFVKEQFEAYLGCGLVPRGCLHVRGEQCGAEMVVAFSCKGHLCPSCGGRRKTALAAQLVDRVVPDVPVRQWVLSLPWSLGYQMAFDAALCRDVLAVHPDRVRLVGAPGGAPRDRGQSMRGGHRDPALRGRAESERALPLPGARRRVHTIAADGGAGLSRAARADRRRGGGRAGWLACHARERLHWPRSRGGLS